MPGKTIVSRLFDERPLVAKAVSASLHGASGGDAITAKVNMQRPKQDLDKLLVEIESPFLSSSGVRTCDATKRPVDDAHLRDDQRHESAYDPVRENDLFRYSIKGLFTGK